MSLKIDIYPVYLLQKTRLSSEVSCQVIMKEIKKVVLSSIPPPGYLDVIPSMILDFLPPFYVCTRVLLDLNVPLLQS